MGIHHSTFYSVILRLSDVASGLPPYEERVLLSSMDAEPDCNGLSQRSGYDELYGTLRAALADALAKGSRRLLATYLQTLLAYPDGCTQGETVFDPETEDVLVQVPPLPVDRLYPKEQAPVDLVAAERLQGRRVLVYATHTGTRDITGRMEDFLSRHGFKVAVMKADAVPPERREAWMAKRAEEGELPEDGLAAYGDDGDDLLLALARKIVAGEEDAGSVESVFEQARQVAAEAEALLVDEGWHAPGPVIAEAEPVAAGGGADEPRDDAPERQRTLFSWAEFMADTREEPLPPRGRRHDEASTLSLFDWVLEREQEGALAA